jgi:hypothetical protein
VGRAVSKTGHANAIAAIRAELVDEQNALLEWGSLNEGRRADGLDAVEAKIAAFDALLTDRGRLAEWAREATHGGSIYSNDAHDVMTELGLWKQHDGKHDYMGGACRICGKFYSGAEFLAAMEAHRASMTPEEQAAEDDEFFGPCPHGRDPWTRCEQGCDTIEQAKGLVPPTPSVAELKARIAELEAGHATAWSAGVRYVVAQVLSTGKVLTSSDPYEDANPYRRKG